MSSNFPNIDDVAEQFIYSDFNDREIPLEAAIKSFMRQNQIPEYCFNELFATVSRRIN